MMIKFSDILRKYNLKPKGILHVGAHRGEELEDYLAEGIDNIIFIEAMENPATYLKERCKDYPNIRVIHACVSDLPGVTDFYQTSNGQSSSMLPLKTHLTEHPDVTVVDTYRVKTHRIDSLVKEDLTGWFLNLDIQGAELKAIRGMGTMIMQFIAVYTEVNVKELYAGCAMLDDMDAYLGACGFKRKEEVISGHGWGDALFIKA